jgi:hypothetical protein
MTPKDKVVINLATGLEDGKRVTVAFLVAGEEGDLVPNARQAGATVFSC